MSEIRCEHDLEWMTTDRNKWRDRALRAENEADQLRDILKSLVENLQEKEIGGKGELAEARRNRDRWRRRAEIAEEDVNRLAQSSLRNVEIASEVYEENVAAYRSLVNTVGDDYFEHSALAAAIQKPAATVIETRQHIVQQAQQRAMDKWGIKKFTLDPYNHPGYCYEMANEYNFHSGVLQTVTLLHLEAYGHSDDPPLIARQLLVECRVLHKPELKTIQRLPSNWVKNAPKPETLAYALEVAWQFKCSDQTQDQFSPNNVRTLRKYLAWYDALERLSREMPDDIKTKLEEAESND